MSVRVSVRVRVRVRVRVGVDLRLELLELGEDARVALSEPDNLIALR